MMAITTSSSMSVKARRADILGKEQVIVFALMHLAPMRFRHGALHTVQMESTTRAATVGVAYRFNFESLGHRHKKTRDYSGYHNSKDRPDEQK